VQNETVPSLNPAPQYGQYFIDESLLVKK